MLQALVPSIGYAFSIICLNSVNIFSQFLGHSSTLCNKRNIKVLITQSLLIEDRQWMESSIELMYQPSEQFDLLQGFGVTPKVAENIDKLHQESFGTRFSRNLSPPTV